MELLNIRKKRKIKKRIIVEGKLVFTTEEVLQIVKKIETTTSIKKLRKQSRKRKMQEMLDNGENGILDNGYPSSNSDYIVLAARI